MHRPRELAKYNLVLVAIQLVRWDDRCSQPAEYLMEIGMLITGDRHFLTTVSLIDS
jgi:hypothetical protein